MSIVALQSNPLALLAGKSVAEIERACLPVEQVKCNVIHRFGPGFCIREVTIPADTFAVGHHQNFEHFNILLKGRVTVVNENGSLTELVAPLQFIGKPGRKVGYVHEEMVWLNIWRTDETDIEKIEAHFLTKSDDWRQDSAQRLGVDSLARQKDRDDFARMLEDTGFDAATAREQSENESDRIEHRSALTMLADSPIEGRGVFATCDIEPGQVIAVARIGGKRTDEGRYTNHAAEPNARMIRAGENINLIAVRPIAGCVGGRLGDEITVDYRDSVRVAKEMH